MFFFSFFSRSSIPIVIQKLSTKKWALVFADVIRFLEVLTNRNVPCKSRLYNSSPMYTDALRPFCLSLMPEKEHNIERLPSTLARTSSICRWAGVEIHF